MKNNKFDYRRKNVKLLMMLYEISEKFRLYLSSNLYQSFIKEEREDFFSILNKITNISKILIKLYLNKCIMK